MGLRSASPAYDVLRVVLLGAATGIVLVHLNRAWSGAGADAGPAAGAAGAGAADRRGDYKYTDKYTSDAVNDVAIVHDDGLRDRCGRWQWRRRG